MSLFTILSLSLSAFICTSATYASIEITSDAALLNALRNESVYYILISSNIKLGPTWAYVTMPIWVQRNLTISSSSTATAFELDMDFYPDILHLGDHVFLTFSNLTIVNGKRKAPLEPGLDCIAGGEHGSRLIWENILIFPSCCFPIDRWGDYLANLMKNPFDQSVLEPHHENVGATLWRQDVPRDSSEAFPLSLQNTSPTILLSSGWDQVTNFEFIQDIAYSSPTLEINVSVSYDIYWYNVTFLCEAETTGQCLNSFPVEDCLQCLVDPTDDESTLEPNLQIDAASNRSLDSIAIWLPILLTLLVVAAGLLGFLWWRRNIPHGLSLDKGSPVEPDVEAARAGVDSRDLNKASKDTQESRIQNKPRKNPRSDGASSERSPDLTSSNAQQRSREVGVTSTSDPSRNVEPRPLQHMGAIPDETELEAVDHASSVDNISLTVGISASTLWASGSQLGARSDATGPLFNAAAAIASITSSQWPSDRDEMTGAKPERDLKRRVQQIADEMLVTGAQDEKLVLGRMIGRGAFGVVYQGWWRGLEVAIKTILMSHHDPSLQEKALMEAALASSVVHPNVVSMYHYDLKPMGSMTTHGTLHDKIEIVDHKQTPKDWKMYLVQELCQTSLAYSLEKFIFHDEPTGMPRMDLIVAVLLDIAHGVAHIHSKNILWGDLKPENVLLKMEPSRLHGIIAKISDFGLSTTIDPGKSHVSNYNKGTVGYSAPEVVKSHQATVKSDVFSFGVLMQAMMLRATPCRRDEEGRSIIDTTFWRPIHGAPPAFMDLRRKCLSRDPNLRPSFADISTVLQIIYDWGMGFSRLTQGQPLYPTPPHAEDPTLNIRQHAGPGVPLAHNDMPSAENVSKIDPAFMAKYRQQMQAQTVARAQAAHTLTLSLAQQQLLAKAKPRPGPSQVENRVQDDL